MRPAWASALMVSPEMVSPVHGERPTPRLIVPSSGLAASAALPRRMRKRGASMCGSATSCTAAGSPPRLSHQLGLSGTGLPVVGQATVRAQR